MIQLIDSDAFFKNNYTDICIISKRSLFEKKDIQKLLQDETGIFELNNILKNRKQCSVRGKKSLVHLIICDENKSRYNSKLNISCFEDVLDQEIFLSEIGCLCICDNINEVFFYMKVINGISLVDFKSSQNKKNYYMCFLVYPQKTPFLYKNIYKVFDLFINTKKMIDLPSNIVSPDFFELRCLEVAERNNVDIKIIKGEDLRKENFGGLYNVGIGSKYAPRLIILSHGEDSEDGLVIVGKGITFDSGGKSLKTTEEQIGMKTDMAGAAVALNVFDAIIQLYPSINISIVLCIAENSIGKCSMNNDDVIKLYSGKTVEITNTDSEGRIILADGVSYACKNMKKKLIVDIGTLTANQPCVAGDNFGSIVTNDETCERDFIKAGRETGDLLVSLPFCPEIYLPKLKSNIADLINSPKKNEKGRTVIAAHFIGNNINLEEKNWVHLDIFGPVLHKGRSTGFGFFLLLNYLENSIKNKTEQTYVNNQLQSLC